jgi:hypothetical protein
VPIESFLNSAGRWLLESGIQDRSGGVARYYNAETQENYPISTEITGYAVSTFVYLHSLSKDRRYLSRASEAGTFLCRTAWDPTLCVMPFDWVRDPAGLERFSYFFDAGIITRGLLALWRATGNSEFLETARGCGQSMACDFQAAEGEYHPIIRLPGKTPIKRDWRWSRNSGCYQLKAALAWLELAEATGEKQYAELYEQVLEQALRTHEKFLPGHAERPKVMDRLHAYSYFLEGLLPVLDRPRCRRAFESGTGRARNFFKQIAPEFERSDVSAQLLRARVYAESLAGIAPDGLAAESESNAVLTFWARSLDLRINGGVYFGRAGKNLLPFVNPVSTAFGLQAVVMWAARQNGERCFDRRVLI